MCESLGFLGGLLSLRSLSRLDCALQSCHARLEQCNLLFHFSNLALSSVFRIILPSLILIHPSWCLNFLVVLVRRNTRGKQLCMITTIVAILVEMLCGGALEWGRLAKAIIIIRERI